ncbi:MAG: TRAP transporter fused permease subunit, partial [Chloroflexota bacterium]|nr:TRAP transporter fused permease subunit [Chloroflexota bacterium]
YLLINYFYIVFERMYYVTPLVPVEKAVAIISLILVLEAARRTVGAFLSITALIFIIYVFVGPYLPGILYHPPVSLDMFLDLEYLTTGGIFGIPLGISATYIVLFIIFGAFMLQTGFGELVTDVATAVAGRFRGGPAKVAILSSALFGTISGSGSANVAVCGTFTIPMMKKIGFSPHFAGAVEAAAATGGELMPPVMGAAAFLMAEYTGIPYISIAKHAALIAILYFVSVYFMVDLEAAKMGIRGLKKEELPKIKHGLANYGHLIVPVIVLLYLLVIGRSLFFSVTISIFASIAMSYVRRKTALTPKKLITALSDGARGTVVVAIACAIAGIIIGAIYITGLGDRFTSLVVAVSGGSLIPALFFTMLAALILGMGMPISPVYILMVALVIPALIKIGVPTLQAHMFVFYYACLSLITPPVASASYVAAGIAGASRTITGWVALKMAAATFLVPFMFIYAPALLVIGTPGEIALAAVTSIVGVFAFATGLQGWGFKGHINIIQRIMALGAAVLLIFPGLVTDLMGAALLALLYFWEFAANRRAALAKY